MTLPEDEANPGNVSCSLSFIDSIGLTPSTQVLEVTASSWMLGMVSHPKVGASLSMECRVGVVQVFPGLFVVLTLEINVDIPTFGGPTP